MTNQNTDQFTRYDRPTCPECGYSMRFTEQVDEINYFWCPKRGWDDPYFGNNRQEQGSILKKLQEQITV